MSNIDKRSVQAVADLKAGYTLGHADVAMLNELARIALASLEAEAVAYTDAEELRFPHATSDMWPVPLGHGMDLPLYTATPALVSVPDVLYQQLSELYHAQEKRLFKLAQRIKGQSFDKYAHSPSQAIDVLESAIFGEREEDYRAAMLQGAAGNSPVIPDAYEIKSFGFFSAVAGDDDLILQIEKFSFDSGKLSQPEIGDFVPRLALQAIINKLQEHCDKLGNRPLDNVLSGLGREE